jgi:UDPglucose--hexose-1-phosphate uridylyltransferase
VWEQRWHPLREEWVIIAAHRQHRPWSGEEIRSPHLPLPAYVEDCYLCPGNRRVDGQVNPEYRQTFVFDNDLPCVAPHAPDALPPPSSLYRSTNARGFARVVCYTPRHDLTLAELDHAGIEALLRVWQAEYAALGAHADVAHVLIFENKGEVVGVSNPHPHCQVYATNFVFKTIETEARVSARHLAETGRVLFQDVLDAEQRDGRRLLAENDSAIAFIPYFARYAYETYVAPKETHPSIAALSPSEVSDLAVVLKQVLVRFDNLWRMSFPYVMTLHQAPTDAGQYPGMHFHIEFHPPLRTPTLLKYLAGPEIGGGNFLSDTSPEEKAAELQAVATIHYKHAGLSRAAGR